MRYLLIVFLSFIGIIGNAQILITSEQLRETNLIFLEHKQFKQQIPLLQLQIDNLEQINYSWQKTDSINQTIIYNQKPIIYLYSPIRITAIRKKFKNIFPSELSGLIYNLDEIYIQEGES